MHVCDGGGKTVRSETGSAWLASSPFLPPQRERPMPSAPIRLTLIARTSAKHHPRGGGSQQQKQATGYESVRGCGHALRGLDHQPFGFRW